MKTLSKILKILSIIPLFVLFYSLLFTDVSISGFCLAIAVVLFNIGDMHLYYSGEKTTVDWPFKKYIKEENIKDFNKEYAVSLIIMYLCLFIGSILGLFYTFLSVGLLKKMALIIIFAAIAISTIMLIKAVKKYEDKNKNKK